tara:strand:+ start:230 stop:409 length:180 start_codon:yes stop_codon:yes gene_type:complete
MSPISDMLADEAWQKVRLHQAVGLGGKNLGRKALNLIHHGAFCVVYRIGHWIFPWRVMP